MTYSPDVEELFAKARAYAYGDEELIEKLSRETKKGALIGAGANLGSGLAMGATRNLKMAGLQAGVGAALGGATGALVARNRRKKSAAVRPPGAGVPPSVAKAWDSDTKRTAAATGLGAAAGAGAARAGGTGVLRAAQGQLNAGIKSPTVRGAARLGQRARSGKGMALGAGIGAIAASPHRKRS